MTYGRWPQYLRKGTIALGAFILTSGLNADKLAQAQTPVRVKECEIVAEAIDRKIELTDVLLKKAFDSLGSFFSQFSTLDLDALNHTDIDAFALSLDQYLAAIDEFIIDLDKLSVDLSEISLTDFSLSNYRDNYVILLSDLADVMGIYRDGFSLLDSTELGTASVDLVLDFQRQIFSTIERFQTLTSEEFELVGAINAHCVYTP
ncbi:MAG: hypothetical protein ACFB0C_17195 [Leptolyngbyaceae cyanobacterium]